MAPEDARSRRIDEEHEAVLTPLRLIAPDDPLAVVTLAERVLEVTDVALDHLAVDDLLSALLQRVAGLLGVDTAAILLLDEDGDTLVARAAKGLEEEVEQGVRIPVGKGFAGRIAADRRPVVLDDVDHTNVLNPLLREKGVRSLLGVPLVVGGRVIGVLHVGSLRRRLFREHDTLLLQLVADRAARAIQHALYERERHIVETLQRSILPHDLPIVDGVDAAVRYLPGTAGANTGGDWYDVIPLPGGRVGLAIGDVFGRGVRAASVMGHFRNGLRAYAIEGHSPSRVAELLDHFVQSLEPGEMATFLYMVLDTGSCELTYVNAGHLPPLVVAPSGDCSFLEGGSSVPIGVLPGMPRPAATTTLKPGSRLVLFTDGLVERRDSSIDVGLERLRRAVEEGSEDLEKLCEELLEHMLTGQGSSDDVAILALRHVPAPARRLQRRLEAEPSVLSPLRHELNQWLRSAGAADPETYEITLACAEACAKAIEHGHGPDDGVFEVDAALGDGDVVIAVRDFGPGWAPAGRDAGQTLIEALMDEVQIVPEPGGTEVRMRRRIGGEVDTRPPSPSSPSTGRS